MDKYRLGRFALSLLLGIIICGHVFLLTPAIVYMGNSAEFGNSMLAFLPPLFRIVLGLGIVIGILGVLFHGAMFARFVCVLAIFGILIWVQGNLLVWDYGALDGREVDWKENDWKGWLEILAWGLALFTAFFFGKNEKLQRNLIALSCTIFALQCSYVLMLGISDPKIFHDKSADFESSSVSEMFNFSPKMNVLHLIADGFQTDIFEEIVNDPTMSDRFKESLSGFVFYKDNLSAFPYTHLSVPAIVSGKVYQNHEKLSNFKKRTFNESVLSLSQMAGFEVDIAAPTGLLSIYRDANHTYAYNIDRQLHIQEFDQLEFNSLTKLIDLSLFRSSPHHIKRVIYNEQRWFTQAILFPQSDALRFDFIKHNLFVKDLAEGMGADRRTPVYKFMHLMLSHNPMVARPDCTFAGRVLPTIRPHVLSQARCGLLNLIAVLDAMKLQGIYDDALIIIMGDHGAWVGPTGVSLATDESGREKPMIIPPNFHALATPLLAIKLPQAKGPMVVSSVPTWTPDLAKTIATVLGLDHQFDHESIPSLEPGHRRLRSFNLYQYDRGEWTADYLKPIHKMIVSGDVYNSGSWFYAETLEPPAGHQ